MAHQHWPSSSRIMAKSASEGADSAVSPDQQRRTIPLTELPAEILRDTISRLSIREICRARRLSKYFKQFIHANQKAILRRQITFHQTRVAANYEYLTQLSGMSAREVFERALRLCGHMGDPNMRGDFVSRFFDFYLCVSRPDLTNSLGSNDLCNVFDYTTRFTKLLLRNPKQARKTVESYKLVLESNLTGEVRKALTPTGGELNGELVKMLCCAGESHPTKPGPPNSVEEYHFLFKSARYHKQKANPEQLLSQLSVPSLAWIDGYFSYYVKDDRMQRLMLSILMKSRSQNLSQYEVAGILEHLSIW